MQQAAATSTEKQKKEITVLHEHMLGYNYKETKTWHNACWSSPFRKSPDKNGEGVHRPGPKQDKR